MTSTTKNHHPPLSFISIDKMLRQNHPNFYVEVQDVYVVYVLPQPNNAWDVCECGYTAGSMFHSQCCFLNFQEPFGFLKM